MAERELVGFCVIDYAFPRTFRGTFQSSVDAEMKGLPLPRHIRLPATVPSTYERIGDIKYRDARKIIGDPLIISDYNKCYCTLE